MCLDCLKGFPVKIIITIAIMLSFLRDYKNRLNIDQ